jgi:alkanesulfonate monooxygenase SsuD/methylene tetrahydromethanopterin reductase-like flavin-dependent oxidoreductase (luciferase family)
MMNQYPMSVESLQQKHQWYCDAYQAAGHDPAARRSGVSFMACIGDNEEDALARAGVPLAEHAGAFVKLIQHREWDDDRPVDMNGLAELSGATDPLALVRERTLLCSPAEAAERLEPYARMGFTEAIFIVRFGDMDPRFATETIERLSREVKPLLMKRLGRA